MDSGSRYVERVVEEPALRLFVFLKALERAVSYPLIIYRGCGKRTLSFPSLENERVITCVSDDITQAQLSRRPGALAFVRRRGDCGELVRE